MSDSEPFQLVTTSSRHKIFDDYEELHSAHGFDQDTSLQKALRGLYPELALTVASAGNGMPFDFTESHFKLIDYLSEPPSIRCWRECYSRCGHCG